MRTITVDNYEEWRTAARDLLCEGLGPWGVRFVPPGGQGVLGLELEADRPQVATATATASVPKAFLDLARGLSCHRDPDRFERPDVLDVGRQPNRHLAFASGAHQCVGMNVARLEGRVAIGRFLDRFPNYAADGAFVRGGRVRFRGFLSVPVAL